MEVNNKPVKQTDISAEIEQTNDERKHMENLLCNRFNFFLAFFTAVIGGAIMAFVSYNYIISTIILIFGLRLCYLMWQPIKRAQVKLDIILAILLHDNHPNNTVEDIIKMIQNGYIKKDEKEIKTIIINNNLFIREKIKDKIKKGNPERWKMIKQSKTKRNYVGSTIPRTCIAILSILLSANALVVLLMLIGILPNKDNLLMILQGVFK